MMNNWTKWMAAGLAAAWGTAAQGEIMSTWEFPENVGILEEEYASSTNVTEVLGVGRTLDENGVVVLYRKNGTASADKPAGVDTANGELAALVVNEAQFLSAFRLTRAANRGVSGRATVAWDKAANYAGSHSTGDSLVGGDGGEGWSAGVGWGFIAGGNIGTMKLGATTTGEARFLSENTGDGTSALVRQLETPLSEGEVRVSEYRGAEVGFRGFSVYAADMTELFRWGVENDEDKQLYGYCVAFADADNEMKLTASQFLFDPEGKGIAPSDDETDYSLTWTRSDEGLTFELTAYYTDDISEPQYYFQGYTWSVRTEQAVAAVGVTLVGNGATIRWDYPEVYGMTAVPEPGTMALLLSGAALLAGRRSRGRKREA